MNKKAALATFLALGVALVAYFIMRFVPTVVPPHRIFVDSVVTKVVDGKQKHDTIWEKVPDIELTNHLGEKVKLSDLRGKLVVADFFFTTCPTICPQMTLHMKQLQSSIKPQKKVGTKDTTFVHFVSFTVDPERDSVPQLKKFADRFQINPKNWWLVTGDKKEIYDLARDGMKLGINEVPVDATFIHPQKFILIDKDGVIRARKDKHGNVMLYDGLDTTDLKALAEDMVLLSLEKDPNREFFLSGKLEIIAVVFVLVAIGLVLLFTYLKKEKK